MESITVPVCLLAHLHVRLLVQNGLHTLTELLDEVLQGAEVLRGSIVGLLLLLLRIAHVDHQGHHLRCQGTHGVAEAEAVRPRSVRHEAVLALCLTILSVLNTTIWSFNLCKVK